MSNCISDENRTDAFNDFIHERDTHTHTHTHTYTKCHILIASHHKKRPVQPGLLQCPPWCMRTIKGREKSRLAKAVGENCACEKGKRKRERSCRQLGYNASADAALGSRWDVGRRQFVSEEDQTEREVGRLRSTIQ